MNNVSEINIPMIRTLFFLSFTVCLHTFSQPPSYEAVLTYMHENIEVNPKRGNFKLAKKPNGYFICAYFYDKDQSIKHTDYQQIWSSITKSFIQPTFNNEQKFTKNKDTRMTSRFSDLWSGRQQFVPLLYYGYKGWIKDTKSVLEKKPDITPKELETLARTYSAEANQYTHHGQYAFSGLQEKKYKDAGYSKISTERVNGFKRAYDKCLQKWEEIREKDNTYSPNLITDLNLKIANEYMHGYFTLNCIHEPELANEYLNKTYYSTSFITYAKKFLEGCDKNGILFTNGDSDTYPLWYVQDKLGFRTDVTLINLSLAQTPWYLEFLMDRYQLKSSFSAQEVRENQLKYFLFRENEVIDFRDWVESFRSAQKKVKSEEDNRVWVDGKWGINVDSDSIVIDKENFAYAYEVFLYDIIASNPDRKIFSTSLYSFLNLGLLDYCIYSGYLGEMKTTLQRGLFTSESESKIIELIKNLPTDYFTGPGDWYLRQRSFNLNFATRVDRSKADQIVPIVEKHILSNLTIDNTAPYLANDITIFYQKFNEIKQEKYQLEYETEAITFVKNFVLRPTYLYDDLEDFYALISMYTSIPKIEMTGEYGEAVNWGGGSTLYHAIKAKLMGIQQKCENDRLKTSSAKISVLLNILSLCDVK